MKMTFCSTFVFFNICFEDMPVDVTVPITAERRLLLYIDLLCCKTNLNEHCELNGHEKVWVLILNE